MSDTDNKLFLVDAMALIYRAHFAFIKNPRINTKGQNTSATFGFTNALFEILEKEKPSHIGVAFDSYAPTVRHVEYADYKANRDKQPEDISLAIPYIKKILDAFGIPVIECEGYEADDLIGTLAKKARKLGYTVYMFTPDKDFAQLVEDGIYILKPAKMGNPPEIWDSARVKQEFGIKRIDQVVDIQGLMGDSVDNIPGVPGIGPKTAQKLIEAFDTVENLIRNTDKLKDKQKDLINQYADQALLSKKLATIIIDAPVEFDHDFFSLSEPDKEALEAIFAELEFKNLGKRILGKEPEKKSADDMLFKMAEQFNMTIEKQPNEEQTSQDGHKEHYYLLSDLEGINSLKKKIKENKNICFYIEYSTELLSRSYISGIGIESVNDYYYFQPGDGKDSNSEAVGLFKEIFEDPSIIKTGFDLKQTILILNNYGIHVKGELFDVMIAHYLIDSESRHDLDFLSEKYLSKSLIKRPVFSDENTLKNYFCEKTRLLSELSAQFSKIIDENHYNRLFYEVESPLVGVLAEMEENGIKVDQEILKIYSGELLTDLTALEKEIFNISGVSFNINSPLQLGRVLFEIMKIDPGAKKTSKTKQYATGEDVLQRLTEKHVIAQKLLDYRSLQKLKSTYVDALPLLINPITGRIHTSFNQSVTSTGRLSSTNPNMQNIPIRTDRGRFIRIAFIPRNNDFQILSADYSQIELRLIADMSQDESMIESFKKGVDIHQTTAAKIYNVALEEVTPEMRRKAKVVNFGIIYGISGWGLAQRLDIPRREGDEIIRQYFEKFPRIREYMDQTMEFARKNGYVETLLGRKRYIREINSRNAMQRGFAERNAINAPVQGTAADLIKMAMVNISREMASKKLKSAMLLQVHDELVFDLHKEEKDILPGIVKFQMENAMQLKVPLIVEVGISDNWLEAH